MLGTLIGVIVIQVRAGMESASIPPMCLLSSEVADPRAIALSDRRQHARSLQEAQA